MHDLGGGVRLAIALEDSVGASADRVLARGVGEGKLVARGQVVLMLAGKSSRLGECEVGKGLARSREARHDAIENDVAVNIFVEALPQIVAQKASGLRRPEREHAGHRRSGAIEAKRIWPTLVVDSLVPEERDGVAHRGKPQAHYDRIARRIDELVDCAGVEFWRAADLNRALGPIAPLRGVNRNARVALALPHRKAR